MKRKEKQQAALALVLGWRWQKPIFLCMFCNSLVFSCLFKSYAAPSCQLLRFLSLPLKGHGRLGTSFVFIYIIFLHPPPKGARILGLDG
jgi:hypothetical protein